MADDKGGTPASMAETIGETETKVAGHPVTAISMGELGESKPKATHKDSAATTAEFDGGDVTTRTGFGEEGEGDGGQAEGADDQGEGGAQEGADGQEEADEEGQGEQEALGDYDPDNDAVVAAYEGRFVTEAGGPDMDALSAEWFGNAAKNQENPGDGTLNEGTYKFLTDRFGLSRDQIKDIEAGQKALHASAQNSIYERAGGQQALQAALEWGKKGGYTAAQRERFNKVFKGNDQAAKEDAIDALMARYGRAKQNQRGRRPATPGRDVTAHRPVVPEGQAGGDGFASRQEYSKAFAEARKSGDEAKLAEVRRKLRRSAWFKRK